ncbi:MAG: alanine/glycine:cation symporter family protein [Hominimerdicola sp.]
MNIINKINEFIWGVPVLFLMLGGGIFLTFRLRFIQARPVSIFRKTILTLRRKKGCEGSNLSQLQAFSTSLAATVGTGSIVGVGTAICTGGSGAIFWLWVSAFFGMALSYCENYLGVKYGKNSKICGAMSYLEKVGKGKALACIYAVFSVLASLGMGNMTQANSVISSAKEGFNISPEISALALLFFTAFIVAGSKRPAKLCEKLVPFMAIFFIGGSLVILLKKPVETGEQLCSIVKNAFSFKAVAGGSIGAFVSNVVVQGLKRGAFSNEAGLGSTVAVHSSCENRSEDTQGTWGMTEVFIDTMIICTLTALVILVSGISPDQPDIALKAYCAGLGEIGKRFMSMSLILFALATLVGWFFIGEKSWKYLFPKGGFTYKLVYIIAVYIGSVESLDIVLGISDIFNGLMAIPNLIGVLALSKEIKN